MADHDGRSTTLASPHAMAEMKPGPPPAPGGAPPSDDRPVSLRRGLWNAVALALWVLACVYVGSGAFSSVVAQRQYTEFARAYEGWTNDRPFLAPDQVEYRSVEDWKFQTNLETVHGLFPWATGLPEFVNLLLVTMAFSGVGAVVGCIRAMRSGPQTPDAASMIAAPLFGLVSGLLLFSLLAAAGMLMTGSVRFDFHPLALTFVGLTCGLFADEVYDAAAAKLRRLLEV